MSKSILVTGAAGFIGFHLCRKLLSSGLDVIGIDNMNSYYDVELKQKRLNLISEETINKDIFWKFIKADLVNKEEISQLFEKYKPKIVVNLAAQAGVRHSIINPESYINSNIVGFLNILECCRSYKIRNLLYASSSSVYGGNKKIPYSEEDSVNHPVSLYAATKRSNELMAHTYCHLYKLKAIGMRFFTVYGPWGRPDMAPMIFTKAILSGEPIRIFNYGNMSRSFTYIDDIIEIIYKLIKKPATSDHKFNRNKPNPSTSWNCHRIFNVGNEKPVKLLDFVHLLEDELGIKALKEFEDMQLGDVEDTSSDSSSLRHWIGPTKNTSIKIGIKEFINWYKYFYKY